MKQLSSILISDKSQIQLFSLMKKTTTSHELTLGSNYRYFLYTKMGPNSAIFFNEEIHNISWTNIVEEKLSFFSLLKWDQIQLFSLL